MKFLLAKWHNTRIAGKRMLAGQTIAISFPNLIKILCSHLASLFPVLLAFAYHKSSGIRFIYSSQVGSSDHTSQFFVPVLQNIQLQAIGTVYRR
jgi:hypothetical protein